MKVIFTPVKLSKEQEKILINESISRSGLRDIANKKLDLLDMNEIFIMNYLSQKYNFIRKKLQKFEEEVSEFNIDIQLAKEFGVNQNINGEPLKKINLEVTEIFDW